MQLNLRPAAPSDLASIAALMNLAYRGTGPVAGWTSEQAYIDGDRTSEAALREQMHANPEGCFLIASTEAYIHGCVWLEPLTVHTWYLGSLTVDPTLQNAGYGRALLEGAEQWAANHGASTMQMTVVNIRDTLIAWYERRGYYLTGVTQPFPYGDDRFGMPRRDDLAFVVLKKTLTPAA